MTREFVYGNRGTIHHTEHLDVEVDKNGKVVAVWFRCALLPFQQHNVDDTRAVEMRLSQDNLARLKNVTVEID